MHKKQDWSRYYQKKMCHFNSKIDGQTIFLHKIVLNATLFILFELNSIQPNCADDKYVYLSNRVLVQHTNSISLRLCTLPIRLLKTSPLQTSTLLQQIWLLPPWLGMTFLILVRESYSSSYSISVSKAFLAFAYFDYRGSLVIDFYVLHIFTFEMDSFEICWE